MESLFNQIVEPFYPNELTQEELERNLPGYDLSKPFMVLHKKDGDMIIQDVRRLSYDDGHIYLLGSKDDGMYKIGRTKSLKNRMKMLGVLMPFEVSLIHSFVTNDMVFAESKLHSFFGDYHLNGEWFQFEDEQVEYVKNILGFIWMRDVNDYLTALKRAHRL
mgnify:CR=1 FL=1